MYGVSDAFLDAIRQSHAAEVRVDAYRSGALIASDLPVESGSVTVDADSQVRRQLSIEFADPSLMPAPNDTTATLSPFGTELFVQRGVRFPSGAIEWCPLGLFRVDEVRSSVYGSVSVSGPDRSRAVADARFLAPTRSDTSKTIPQEITRLIQQAIPGMTVTDYTGSTKVTPSLVWDRERWEAIDALATSIGADVFFNQHGTAEIRPMPTIDKAIVWWVTAGDAGVLITADRQTSREMTYNVVVASGERSDDTPPVSATVSDTDSTSPTRVSLIGSIPYFYASPLLTTTTQATSTATALLGRVRALSRQVSVTTVPNPALDAGDVIGVRYPDGSFERHLVDKVTVPLDAGSAMAIETRSGKPELE